MTSYIIATLAAVALSLGAWGLWQANRLDDAKSDVERLRRALTAAEEVTRLQTRAAAIAASERIEAEEREARTRAVLEEALTGDFANADAPLDPSLRALIERVQRSD